MIIVDANVLLRYLLDDHSDLSPKAAEIIEQQIVTLPMEVACEVVYVLQKVYTVERDEIQQQLGNLLAEDLIGMEKPAVFLKALEHYSNSKLDFVDCLL
ncbi:PIN domain-containing protein [Synechococcus elongatus]|uniref:PIN domain-containing protein n=1 Tax=Synechococcus elongatus TaxID=32046 RepID=UPI001EDDA6CA|nr:PIN domain-containing protein [Synechococcus elongatus]